MAINIGTLITGNMALGSSGSTPKSDSDTRFWLSNDENDYEDYPIEGTLTFESFDPYGSTEIYKIEIGTGVTSIASYAFEENQDITYVLIPSTVTSIGFGAFASCISLASVTFLGKTITQVQEMDNYPWGIKNTSIINVA